ncbi:hypothetical protein U5801_00895 [Lamprobacter modestohalophilus]|uniref:hypothetical protein n=1 Tax=Lamprobacter modestohalophilus TaxID=1064514 RepID=UPI002ADEEE88|nr:hypothetical protein [Lamprobacter modestohalophilus]MEA1048380.1 hypothetical protein [Lamprobacter modestohalophilus]
MNKLDNTYELAASVGFADRLVEQATKEQLIEATSILAIAVGYYRTRYGEVPDSKLLNILRAEHLDDQSMEIVIAGMQSLASALTEVITGGGGLDDEIVH